LVVRRGYEKFLRRYSINRPLIPKSAVERVPEPTLVRAVLERFFMRYWNLTPMRPELKSPILEGLALPGARNPAGTLGPVIEKLSKIDRGIAERFLMWACKHEIALKPETIDVRFYEYVRKVRPSTDEDAAKIWRAVNPETPGEVLRDLVLHPDAEIHCYVACNWSAPVDVLNLLSTHENEEVRRWVAMHPNTTPEMLARLAHDKDDRVREEVAQHDATEVHVLAELAGDTSWVVRRCVAEHPSTNSQPLARLANDREGFVRVRVASNPLTPAAAVAKLARDSESHVRAAASANPGPPPPVEKTLPDLLQEYEVAKQALLQYLDRKHPSGEANKTRLREGTITSTSINSEDDSPLSFDKASGRLIEVDPVEIDGDPPTKRGRRSRKE
jgi:hypothetical protein